MEWNTRWFQEVVERNTDAGSVNIVQTLMQGGPFGHCTPVFPTSFIAKILLKYFSGQMLVNFTSQSTIYRSWINEIAHRCAWGLKKVDLPWAGSHVIFFFWGSVMHVKKVAAFYMKDCRFCSHHAYNMQSILNNLWRCDKPAVVCRLKPQIRRSMVQVLVCLFTKY